MAFAGQCKGLGPNECYHISRDDGSGLCGSCRIMQLEAEVRQQAEEIAKLKQQIRDKYAERR